MKTLIFFVSFMILFYNLSFSDNCNSPINCSVKAYPYTGCDGKPHCYTNPLFGTPKVMKARLPICLKFQNIGPEKEYSSEGSAGGRIEVYNSNYTQEDCDCTAYEWNCLCGYQNNPCSNPNKCEIKVIVSTVESDFNPAKTTAGVAKGRVLKWPDGSCELICEPNIPASNIY